MSLATRDLFQPLWSDEVHREWMTRLLENHPDLSLKSIERARRLMEAYAEDAIVSGYEDLIETLVLPDPRDRHVVAAAIHCGADTIVTLNLKDFPNETLASYKLVARHPDSLLAEFIDVNPALTAEALAADRASMRHRPMSADEYLLALERNGLKQSASKLRDFKSEL